ncbi:SRPBCC family protein [Streptomyces sp. NRRL S-244]|uniref:SRPBCC family protein n=1 Tax=Streptomyces sp. NRRL S-244 TaxID=1463897 RepID=UPI0004BE7D6F|nr:SRPBCC family protein [Streptomyces sp. NRRL S-244]
MDRSRLDRWNRYRFRSVWDLDAPPARVYSVLEQAGDYPRWWPQVRAVEQSGGQGGPVGDGGRDGDGGDGGRDGRGGYSGTLLIRSLLPYEIRMTATELLRDPGRGLLEAALHGDIEGWARWTVRARRGAGGRGTRALYEQEVEVRSPLLRRLALPVRPAFRLNHALMMRAGRHALEARLATSPEAV